ncbi:hypothetical protein EZS27_016651 [termite gut metagenome]|uniref:Microbial-type PARG catalytic domain-containing protein n=1 Tax=termite gut metagenome TaxID=433724 RepID=A0A5J4RPM4_9ZZZZ
MQDKNNRAQKAHETLQIIEQGFYIRDNRRIDISEQVEESIKNAVLFSPENFEHIRSEVEQEIAARNYQTRIDVKNSTTIDAAEQLIKENGKTACLNFASAKNPGGGFLGGAQAQEESLARASALYPTLTKFFTEMYEYNRSKNTYLYSDYMIYSPDVVFFKNDDDELLPHPFVMDILTSPAVNIGAMKQNKPQELLLARQTMLNRIDKLLSVFVLQNVENLILGAWGCGVFQNKPEDVAGYFADYLVKSGKYANCFNHIVFAVYDRSKNKENISAMKCLDNHLPIHF